MTQSPHGGAAATLARTKRIEIQHFADGGTVRRTTVRSYGKPGAAAALLAQVPASHADAKSIEHGGPVRGPGGPTSDSVPLWGSAGEFMLPADTTAAVGKDKLQALVDATHTPAKGAAEKMGQLARADGGPIWNDPNAVTRVGNSYSGGNVSGPISINGQAPGGTVSTIDAYRAPPAPAPAASVLGTISSVRMLPSQPAALAVPAAPTPAAAAPAAPAAAPAPAAPATPAAATPAPLDYANRNAAFNASAMARTSDLQSGRSRSSGSATAAPPPNSAASTLAARPVQSIASYANGGEIMDPRQRATMLALAAMPPAPPAPPVGTPGASQIPTTPAVRTAAPVQPAEQAQVRQVDNAIDARSALTAAPLAPAAPAPAPAATFQPAGSVGTVDGGATGSERLAQINRDVAFERDKQTWRDPSAPTPGATIIGDPDVDRRAQFNEQANLNNALARTSWSPRRGTQVNDAAVAAAMQPIDARARMAQTTAREAGETARATIQERGADARARLADTRAAANTAIDQQRLGLEGQRVALDANRDRRADAAAETEQAQKARVAQLQNLVLTGTPAQQKMAAGQLAALQGREITGNAPPVGYERTADGNLRYIKGGPADPDTPKGKNNLNDTQAKALQFGSRMLEAGRTLDALAQAGRTVSFPGSRNAIAGGVVNVLNDAQGQQLDQAKRDFVNAVLRRESGAAISQSEFDNAEKQYFPQLGDSDAVIEQKRKNRDLATRGILAEVPDAETRLGKINVQPPPAAGAAAAPAPSAAAAPAAAVGRTVARTGTVNGRRVVQYSDGSIDYAN